MNNFGTLCNGFGINFHENYPLRYNKVQNELVRKCCIYIYHSGIISILCLREGQCCFLLFVEQFISLLQ